MTCANMILLYYYGGNARSYSFDFQSLKFIQFFFLNEFRKKNYYHQIEIDLHTIWHCLKSYSMPELGENGRKSK